MALIFLTLFAHDVRAHDPLDPSLTVEFNEATISEIGSFLLKEAGLSLGRPSSLEGRRFTISIENEPVSNMFRKLRTKYHVCTYQATHPLAWFNIHIQPCDTVNSMCQFGAMKPFPMARILEMEDGTKIREKIGPFLCGGSVYKKMLENGTAVRKSGGE